VRRRRGESLRGCSFFSYSHSSLLLFSFSSPTCDASHSSHVIEGRVWTYWEGGGVHERTRGR
jgi:hypothetical protein